MDLSTYMLVIGAVLLSFLSGTLASVAFYEKRGRKTLVLRLITAGAFAGISVMWLLTEILNVETMALLSCLR